MSTRRNLRGYSEPCRQLHSAPCSEPHNEPRSAVRRLNDYIDSLNALDAAALTVALSQPLPLLDAMRDYLERGNTPGTRAPRINGACLLNFPLSDAEFPLMTADFAPLLVAMRTVMRECNALSERLAVRVVDNGAFVRFANAPA